MHYELTYRLQESRSRLQSFGVIALQGRHGQGKSLENVFSSEGNLEKVKKVRELKKKGL